MSKAFLGLGSNVGDRLRNLRLALHSLQGPNLAVTATSSVYSTEPVGLEDQDEFLNAVLQVETDLDPRGLLELCRRVEDKAGRVRTVRWGPRTLDVDILFYDEVKLDEPDLVIPHPRALERRFVLLPLSDVTGTLPGGTPVAAAVASCKDTGRVEKAGTFVALGDPMEVPLAFIGVGRVGSAMALDLSARGCNVAAVFDLDSSRAGDVAERVGAAPAGSEAEAADGATVVFVTTQDSHVAGACAEASADGSDFLLKTFFHMSGSLGLDALEPAMRKGALRASIHPVQTFADASAAARDLPGSTFAVTADPGAFEYAASLVGDLKGEGRSVADEDRPLYHAAAVIAGNLTTMLMGASAEIYRMIGFGEREAAEAPLPLARTSLSNVGAMGAAAALTGPLSRGDLTTLEANLAALEESFPEAALAYRAVSLLGLRLVEERGEVEASRIAEMKALLEKGLRPPGEAS